MVNALTLPSLFIYHRLGLVLHEHDVGEEDPYSDIVLDIGKESEHHTDTESDAPDSPRSSSGESQSKRKVARDKKSKKNAGKVKKKAGKNVDKPTSETDDDDDDGKYGQQKKKRQNKEWASDDYSDDHHDGDSSDYSNYSDENYDNRQQPAYRLKQHKAHPHARPPKHFQRPDRHKYQNQQPKNRRHQQQLQRRPAKTFLRRKPDGSMSLRRPKPKTAPHTPHRIGAMEDERINDGKL